METLARIRQLLAPAGRLRVGVYPGSPSSMVRNPRTGETRGVALELGRELATRLGVAFEPVEFARVAQVVEAVKSGLVDVTFTNASPARARELDFTPAMLAIEQGFLVLPGSPLSSSVLAEMDRPGIRVGVSQGSTSLAVLSRELRHASLIQAASLKAAIEMLAQRQVDAFATNKGILNQLSDELPGSTVLPGRFGLEYMALCMPKGRDRGRDFLRAFAGDVVSGGHLQRAVDDAGLRGTVKLEI